MKSALSLHSLALALFQLGFGLAPYVGGDAVSPLLHSGQETTIRA